MSQGLTLGPEARLALDSFRDYTVAHPLLRAADEELRRFIAEPAGAALALVYGPTGVGKTTLVTRVQRVINESLAPELAADGSRSGLTVVRLNAPEGSSFWRAFYLQLGAELDDPFFDLPLRGRSNWGERATAAELRSRVVAAVQGRRPPAVLIDEAHHFALGVGPERLMQQLEVIKSLADACEVPFVLVGTYSVLDLRNLNGQLSRRSIDIHFRRYLPTSDMDVAGFRQTIQQLGQRLPVSAAGLADRWDTLYERTAGCIGILKQWLVRAAARALHDGSPTLEDGHLRRSGLGLDAMGAVTSEILNGEAIVAESSQKQTQLRIALGLDGPATGSLPGAGLHTDVGQAKKNRRRVGERSLTRDRVGVGTMP